MIRRCQPPGPMMRTVCFILAVMTGLVVSRSALADRPNVVIVMADDMGFSDIGCFGSEIETPNLDRLASRGVRLTQFYNTGKCCPSRASLLTGLYPHQAGVGWMVSGDLGRPGYRGDLNKRCVTLAEVLGSAGYRCYMTGKWHVTPWDYKRDQGPTHNWPLQRGFDHCLATINGSGNYFGQGSLVRDNVRTKIDPPRYYTDIISDQAADYVRLAADSKDPFLLYVAYTAPHFPLHAKTNDIAKYLGRYMDGWQSIRQQRFARMLDLGLVDRSWKLSPSDAPDWNRLSDDQKILWDKRMAVYAAQIDCMDQGIGRLIEALQQSGQLENTLVLFLSDNGGCAELKNRSDRSLGALGTRRSYESYRREWANVSNTPFRRYKRYAHEGGIATPLLASWPQSIKPRKTPVRDPAHIVDIMATCVDVAQVDYPMQFSGNTITPMEGISLRPLLEGKSLPRPHPLCWEYEGNRAIRDRDWKLVADGLLGAWELYDLKTDRTETTNLASIHPEIVEELSSKWTAWAKRCDVLPLDGRTKAARLGSAVPPAE